MTDSIACVQKYFDLTEAEVRQLEAFRTVLLDWNSRVNLISRKDEASFWERHVLHTLAIAKYMHFKAGDKVMDGGTGGGFPGIPLAILFPDTQFVLVDSRQKKTDTLQQIVDTLRLPNVAVQHARIEEVTGQFDYVVTRAVAPLPKLLAWTRRVLNHKKDQKSTLICLKGGNLKEEMKSVKEKVHQIPLRRWFDEPFFETKYLLVLSPYPAQA